MEKDALLEIIIHDLKEVEILAQNVKGNTQLSKAFFKLTRNRINSILEEIEMLEELSTPENRSSEPTPAESSQEAPPAADVLPKQEPKEDLTPQTAPAPQKPPVDSGRESEQSTKKEPASDETPSEEIKEEPSTTAMPEEKPQKKETPVDREKKPAQKHTTGEKNEKIRNNGVLGEKLVKGKASFNEQIGKNQKTPGSARSFSAPAINDLRKAMGINDRFFFQRELFGGSADVMNQTLEQLNQMQGINDAQNFLLANFNWDPENEAVLSFMELVERRYL